MKWSWCVLPLVACSPAGSGPAVVVPAPPPVVAPVAMPAVSATAGAPLDASAPLATPSLLDAGAPSPPGTTVARVAPRGPERLSEGLSLENRRQSFGVCGSDADCVVTNFGSCCSSCASSPHVRSKKEVEASQHRCWTVDCAMNERERCEPTEPASYYRAVCRDGACDGVRLPTAPR